MKKTLPLIFFSLILVGAGCLGRADKSAGNDGGVFKSVTAGKDWVQSVAVPTSAGVGTLATTDVLNMEMDPQDRAFIYLGTRQNGMLYSEDGGASWRQPRASALKDGLIYRVEVSPTDACRVFIAKGSRLYSSNDCMRTFDSETYVENREDVGVVQIAVDWFSDRNVWIGLSNGDVLKSEDGGGTWRTVLKTNEEVSGILIHNKDSRNVLVSTFDKGVYKTQDGGATWAQVDGGLADLKGAQKVYAMVQDKGSGAVVASSQYGLARSRDFGATWKPITLVSSPGQVTIRAVGMDPKDADTLYYAAVGTFYSSMDAGVTWSTQRLPSARAPRALLVDPSDPSVVYVGVASEAEQK